MPRTQQMSSNRNILGAEFDWFAVDFDGHVGHFSSAGFGPVPLAAEADAGRYDRVFELFKKSPGSRTASFERGSGKGCDDWLKIAQHGIFSYDWKHWNGPYARIATPENPILKDQLPEEIKSTVVRIRFEKICFRKVKTVRPEKFLDCTDGS